MKGRLRPRISICGEIIFWSRRYWSLVQRRGGYIFPSGHGGISGVASAPRVVAKSHALFVRAGAILPMGPVRQYAMQPSDEPVTLLIFPGADGQFSWYQDDGISFAYQHGRSTRIDCTWQNSPRKLTLASSSGSIRSQLKEVRIQAIDTGMTKVVSLAPHYTVVEL